MMLTAPKGAIHLGSSPVLSSDFTNSLAPVISNGRLPANTNSLMRSTSNAIYAEPVLGDIVYFLLARCSGRPEAARHCHRSATGRYRVFRRTRTAQARLRT